MKKLLIGILIGLSSFLSAQDYNCLGMNKDEVRGYMRGIGNNTLLASIPFNDSLIVYHYSLVDDIYYSVDYYFNSKGYCTMYSIDIDYSMMNNMIKSLNEKYTSTGENKWICYAKQNRKIEIVKSDKFFSMNVFYE